MENSSVSDHELWKESVEMTARDLAKLLDRLRERYPEAMAALQRQWQIGAAFCELELLSALMAGKDLESAKKHVEDAALAEGRSQ